MKYNTIVNQELLIQAIEMWGEDAQVLMALEECGEFIAALTQRLRGRDSNIIEEIADCLIMMYQMRYIFGIEAVDAVIAQKMERLELRLKSRNINQQES